MSIWHKFLTWLQSRTEKRVAEDAELETDVW